MKETTKSTKTTSLMLCMHHFYFDTNKNSIIIAIITINSYINHKKCVI